MSEERIEVEESEDAVVNMNEKKKKRIVAIIIATIALLAVGIAVICVAKYRAEHRYIPFEEIPAEQILFVKEVTHEQTNGSVTRVWAYCANGRKYAYEFAPDEYGRIENSYDEIANGEVIENYVATTKVEEMYENLLQVNRRAKYRNVSDIVIMDSGVKCFYGVRFLQNGEVEYIMMWSDSESTGKDLLDDPYAIDICNWMLWL